MSLTTEQMATLTGEAVAGVPDDKSAVEDSAEVRDFRARTKAWLATVPPGSTVNIPNEFPDMKGVKVPPLKR